MTSRTGSSPGRRRVQETAVGYEAFGARGRVTRAVELLGNRTVAEILQVSPSQPSRWRAGKERVSEKVLPRLIELDYIVSRMLVSFAPQVARDWFHGSNPFIGGRPIDVMLLRGPMALKPALDAWDAGAHA